MNETHVLIGQLEQHCGDCKVIDYCGYGFGFCLCTDSRFTNVPVDIFAKYADKASTKPYENCIDCKLQNCEECDFGNESRDYYCEQTADYVFAKIKEESVCTTTSLLQ